MDRQHRGSVYVETLSIGPNQQISGRENELRELKLYAQEIGEGLADTSAIIQRSTADLTETNSDLSLSEFSVKFGISLGAEGGIVLVKTKMTGTLEIEMKFKREK